MGSFFQFSIRGLLCTISLMAIGLAALLNANSIWQGLAWALALYALTAASCLVLYRQSEQRAFWFGFAVFGGLYLFLFLLSQQSWVFIGPLSQGELLGSRLAYWSHETLLPQSRRTEYVQVPAPADPFGPGTAAGMGPPAMTGNPMSGYGGGSMPMMSGAGGSPMSGAVLVANPSFVPLNTYTNVFHALCLLLAAAVGGKTCQLACRTRPRMED